MPHRIEHLRQTLSELEAELAEMDALDDESRELLETAAAEIQQALHKDDPPKPTSWTDRLTDLATDFEESHPSLSRLVGNVANALAQLGI